MVAANAVRIVGGEFRSRSLSAPKGNKTRPTSDRVREAVFSMLESRISLAGVTVLDLYAGTGALGLEALSRGASFCTFVERDRQALEALDKNIQALDLKLRTRVLRRSAADVGNAEIQTPELVFVDPPYADVVPHAVNAVLRLQKLQKLQAPSEQPRLWVFEHDSSTANLEIEGLVSTFSRSYGDTLVTLFVAPLFDRT
jgi:16S rRNA (guanine966-N2)-methyltransferase